MEKTFCDLCGNEAGYCEPDHDKLSLTGYEMSGRPIIFYADLCHYCTERVSNVLNAYFYEYKAVKT